MDNAPRTQFAPGTRVKVTQQIAARDRTWTTTHGGTVVEHVQKPTGSWYAHSKDDRLWLDRLVIRKADGELLTFNLDEYTHIEVESAPPAGAAQGK